MTEFLLQHGFLKLLVLLLAAPLWWPVLRIVWGEMQRVGGSEGSEGTAPGRTAGSYAATPPPPARYDLGSARRTAKAIWALEEQSAWSKRRLVNPRWDRGRRDTRRAPAEPKPGEITRHVVERTRRLDRGGFGRRPL